MSTEILKGRLWYNSSKKKWFLNGHKLSRGLINQLSLDLYEFIQCPPRATSDIEVEYEKTDQHQFTRIRHAEKPFIERVITADPLPQLPDGSAPSQHQFHFESDGETVDKGNKMSESRNNFFHNPYNFIPAPPRNVDHPDLGDQPPISHDRYHADRWSGHISVTLTTHTPLLIPDASRVNEDERTGHKTFPTRLDVNCKPYLPPTSIKGMLRAAYEAVTNSRMGIFGNEHNNRLAFRKSTQEGLLMVPARIVENKDEKKKYIQLYTGTSEMEPDGSPKIMNKPNKPKPIERAPMYAAWLRQYGRGDNNKWRGKFKNKEKVWAYIKLWEHRNPYFIFWNVVEVRSGHLPEPNVNDKPRELPQKWWKANPAPDKKFQWIKQREKWVQGYVCITNHNVNKKHDERIFFDSDCSAIKRIELTPDVEGAWKELIHNYSVTHKTEITRQNKTRPPALSDDCIWSRHIINEVRDPGSESELEDGTLCYAQVKVSGENIVVSGLYPVMISRQLHQESPMKMLDSSISPALGFTNFQDLRLSPADRVFGWVNQSGNGAYRGNIGISSSKLKIIEKEMDSGKEVESDVKFGDQGLPLAILGQPKPQQSRFYGSPNKLGVAYKPNLDRSCVGYKNSKNQGLRGRKVYPHHAQLPAGYWLSQPKDIPGDDLTQESINGFYRNYLSPHKAIEIPDFEGRNKKIIKLDKTKTYYETERGDGVRDNQNRSIKSWVKPFTTFTFKIKLSNLSDFEIGALVWLLSLNEGEAGYPRYHHRLGGGKPLGFGSVTMAIDWNNTFVFTGKDLIQNYSSFEEQFSFNLNSSKDKILETINVYKDTIKTEYSASNFESVPFIKAFLKCCEGFSSPIHYPRVRDPRMPMETPVPPHPDGISYEWFVANEKTGSNAGPKLSLPDLSEDDGLQILIKG